MTLDDVKAQGAKTLGTLSYIPEDDWHEFSVDQLLQVKARLSMELISLSRSRERKYMKHRMENVTEAVDRAQSGERVFGVTWNDEGKDILFASTEIHQRVRKRPFWAR